MQNLSQQRCLHHEFREAVARCPECRGFFCRECITEHDDRVICADCLKKQTTRAAGPGFRLAGAALLLQSGAGLFAAWIFFYVVARVLLSIPDDFHEGTIWSAGFMDE